MQQEVIFIKVLYLLELITEREEFTIWTFFKKILEQEYFSWRSTRGPTISKYFDKLDKKDLKICNTYRSAPNNKRVSVYQLDGCDNIDIVINELDALVNIDFEKVG